MKYDKMTPEQMAAYVRRMDEGHKKLLEERERILQEVRKMQERKEILSWEEIAAAIAYPKAMPDREHVSGGNPDEFKLLRQAEKINKIYISQMEELFEELESVEMQIIKHKYVSRCISRLGVEEKDIIERFIRSDMTYEKGSNLLHTSRSSLYRLQKKALAALTEMYNTSSE